MTLLEAAMAAPTNRREIDPEVLELAIAYFHGQITDRQAAEALKCAPSSAASQFARVIKWAIAAETLKPLEMKR